MLGGYTLVDIAHKVVGVGSVAPRYVALLEGSSPDDVVFLQLKQARRSVLAPYVHGESAWHAHQGQRVVEYQQALQTVSDPLLGWTTIGDQQYYVRQFRNMKGSIALDAIDAAALTDYAGIVGHLLAKGHARTSGASMIASYAGVSDKLDQALASLLVPTPIRPRPIMPSWWTPSGRDGYGCRRCSRAVRLGVSAVAARHRGWPGRQTTTDRWPTKRRRRAAPRPRCQTAGHGPVGVDRPFFAVGGAVDRGGPPRGWPEQCRMEHCRCTRS